MPSVRSEGLVALRFASGVLRAIDQTALPFEEREFELGTAEDVAAAIARLSIRGAPLIGVAAGYGVALELMRGPGGDRDVLERACDLLRAARPTAVNLAHAVDRVRAAALQSDDPAAAALTEAKAIHAEEEAASAAMGEHGADVLSGARRILTHCNTGALAAPGRGTAFSLLAELHDRGGLDVVIATESRPLLQGARLTVYELSRAGIPHELVVDGAAPALIAGGAVDAVVVGCDRVAANGDVANKVGTYSLALAARAAGIPFVVAGPTSTVDSACASGSEIEIEQRGADEVRMAGGRQLTLPNTSCRNPAFDVTPAALITAIVTERGVAEPGSVIELLG